MEKIKALPRCICKHYNYEHCRSVSLIHHCQVYDCNCKKWEWDKKTRYLQAHEGETK